MSGLKVYMLNFALMCLRFISYDAHTVQNHCTTTVCVCHLHFSKRIFWKTTEWSLVIVTCHFLSNCHVQFHHCLTVHRFQTSVNQIISVRLTSSEAIQKSIKYGVKSIEIDSKIYFFSLIIYLFIMEIMIEVQW